MTPTPKRPLLVIVGPTASGKTALAINLAKAFDGEIVSADSMQVYKELNIGAAKPTLREREGIVHHMLDVVSVCENYTVSDYEQQATRCIHEIYDRGKLPILCGGTGLYIRAVLHGLSFAKAKGNEQIRQKWSEYGNRFGNHALHQKLKDIDPQTARQLHLNDVKRIIRALEVYEQTGQPYSLHNQQETVSQTNKFDSLLLGLQWERSKLVARIQKRVALMVDQGLIQEAKRIYDLHLPRSMPSMQGLGYKQLFDCFDGTCSQQDALEHIFIQTRQYAKRQMTWFRRQETVDWILAEDSVSLQRAAIEKVAAYYKINTKERFD